jgi:two-component system OmpR family sensor kinase
MSVRLRLTLWYAGLTALTLIISSIALYFVLNEALTAETDAFLESKAHDLAASTQIIPVGGPCDVYAHLPDLDRFVEGDVYAQVIGCKGLIDESMSMGGAGAPMDPQSLPLAARGQGTFSTVTIRGLRIRVYTMPIVVRGTSPLILEVGRTFERVEQTMVWLQRFLLIGDLAVLALASAVGWWMSGSSLRPIARITRTAKAIGESQRLDQRVDYDGPMDEIGELVHTFNHMLGRLEASIGAQRRFVADASHELRTPLTTLRLNVDLLRRDQTAETPERAEVLDDVASELDRLSRLVQGLLDLARADAGFHLDRQSVRADEIVRDVYHQVKPASDGVTLQVGDLVPMTLQANPDYLKQLLITLVDNAVKYTSSGGLVQLDLERDGHWIKFRVADSGRGIAFEDLPHIFERFYRARSVRRQRGTGLGLAVAQWIAQEHGGHIEVQSEPGRGSVFTVWLPES